jgi:hypothetical protein
MEILFYENPFDCYSLSREFVKDIVSHFDIVRNFASPEPFRMFLMQKGAQIVFSAFRIF